MESYNRPIIYVTLGDSPNGIYKTQVADVVELYKTNTKSKVYLVSFVSIRGYFKSKKKINQWCSQAWVFPMIPKLKNWKTNSILLKIFLFFFGENAVLIGRGIFSANVLLTVKTKNQKVVYDGRGAIWAEAKEFSVYENSLSNNEILHLENTAINEVDYSIAVSDKLVCYWREQYGYKLDSYTVIPCSFSPGKSDSNVDRNSLGWKTEDVVFVYSGSNDGWQGLDSLKDIFISILSLHSKYKLLLLMKNETLAKSLNIRFENQVIQKWVAPELVKGHLDLCDYGILIRPNNLTNQVASPVKFAEYLASGLEILISPEIGDFSDFVLQEKVGYVITTESEITKLCFRKNNRKKEIEEIATKEFSKESPLIRDKYLTVIN